MKKKRSGKIVNLASIAGRGLSFNSSSAYAAAKGGIIAFTRKLAFELGPDGINVNAIAPSITLTERIRPHWDKRSQASQAEEIERTPLRRVAEAADQANVICFLASSDADFVTGPHHRRHGRRLADQPAERSMAGKVGFIGLGAMGGPMALNLAKAGYKLVVHDIDQSKTAAVRAQGAELAGNAEAVAAAVDRTILIVETTEQAEAVIAGERGIIQGAKPGHIVVCMATIDPFAARALAEQLKAKGIAMVDAPVSGGTGARAVGRAVGDRGRRQGRGRQVRGPVQGDGQPHASMSGRWAAGSP